MSTRATPRFVAGNAGGLFVMDYRSDDEHRGVVLFAPPFAEEMNRARRMVSLQSRALAGLGYRVVVPDLFGTGDSDGEFADARWSIWLEDLAAVLDSCASPPATKVTIWGLRLGALLGLDAANRGLIGVNRAVLWSPCVRGGQFVTQFLRMRAMAGMITRTGARESIAEIDEQLTASGFIEVAGYDLSRDLVSEIRQLDMDIALVPDDVPIDWFELVSDAAASFPPGPGRAAKALVDGGCDVRIHCVEGPAFWATAETSTAPRLMDAMADVLDVN